MSSFSINNASSPAVQRKLGFRRVNPLHSRRVSSIGSIASKKCFLKQRCRGKSVIRSQQFDKDFDVFSDVNQRIIESQIDLETSSAILDPETEQHHQQLLTEYTRMSRATPLEVRYWQQFGFKKMPPDVAEAFLRWSLFRNKKARKLIRKGKGKKGTKIPEVLPPNPMIYLCEKYPKCCPVKYRRLTVKTQQNLEKDEFWWARGFWDGVPKDVQEYQEKYSQMTYVEKLKAMSVKQFVSTHYPEIQIRDRTLDPYFERDEFPEMLKRETAKLQQQMQSPDIPVKHRNSRKNMILVTWEIVLQERRVKEEEIRKLIERKQAEKQRHKIMERFQLEVKTPKLKQGRKKQKLASSKVQNERKLLVVKKASNTDQDQDWESGNLNGEEDGQMGDKHADKLRNILDQI